MYQWSPLFLFRALGLVVSSYVPRSEGDQVKGGQNSFDEVGGPNLEYDDKSETEPQMSRSDVGVGGSTTYTDACHIGVCNYGSGLAKFHFAVLDRCQNHIHGEVGVCFPMARRVVGRSVP